MPTPPLLASQPERYIPHFVPDGGYTTEFNLMGSGEGAIEFYLQQGGVLGLSFSL